MTRRSRGLLVGCGGLIALGFFTGCANDQQRAKRPSSAASLAEATVTTAANAVSAAAGAAAGVVTGAATGTASATGASPPKRQLPAGAVYWSDVGVKRNGRGGYTASPAQKARHKAVQRQAMAYRKYMNSRRAKQGGSPTTRPAGR